MRRRRRSRKKQTTKTPDKPGRSEFTRKEWALIQSCRTPPQVQRCLRSLPYNHEKKETLRTLRGVVRHGTAHCLEAVLVAATILEQHGYPPLVLSLESVDDLDHVLFLFRKNGKYGTVGRSRDVGLHGRKPVFRSVRDLVMSYVDTYVDGSGRINGYGVGNLNDLVKCDWRLSRRHVWEVEKALIFMPHKKLKTSDRRHKRILRRLKEFKRKVPGRPVNFYSNCHQWL